MERPARGVAISQGADYRYERKFHAPRWALSQVELAIKVHPGHFRVAFPPRYINNVYFDTPSFDDYHVHVNGAAVRSKLRLRWYGAARGRVARPVLEIKAKVGDVGHKPSFPLGQVDIGDRWDRTAFAHCIDSAGVPPAVRERLARSRPSLFNRYHRRYYATTDGLFRLTVDTELRFQTLGRRPYGPRRIFEERNLVIIELKYAGEHDALAQRISAGLPFRLTKMSKYLHGVQVLAGLGE